MRDRSTLNTATFPQEMQLLLALLKTENKDDFAANDRHLLRGTDWSLFIALARHHRVDPYLHAIIQACPVEEMPAGVVRALRRDYRQNALRMLQLSGEIDHLGRRFAEEDIRILNLKGPVIAKELYGDISLRTCGDLDFLIPLPELYRAESLLVTLGYVKDDYIHSVLGDWKWRHHHITFSHPLKGIKVELHWRLNPAPSSDPDFETLWTRRRVSLLTGQPAYYLGSEDLFLFLASHGARHGWSRLRWLLDIKMLMKQHPDSDMLLDRLREHRQSHTGGQALVLAAELLGAETARGLQALTAAPRPRQLAEAALFYVGRMLNLHDPPLPAEVERYHKRHLYALLTRRQRMLFRLSFLFPYPEDAETLPLPKPLHFLYVPLRPFLWSWRKMAGAWK